MKDQKAKNINQNVWFEKREKNVAIYQRILEKFKKKHAYNTGFFSLYVIKF